MIKLRIGVYTRQGAMLAFKRTKAFCFNAKYSLNAVTRDLSARAAAEVLCTSMLSRRTNRGAQATRKPLAVRNLQHVLVTMRPSGNRARRGRSDRISGRTLIGQCFPGYQRSGRGLPPSCSSVRTGLHRSCATLRQLEGREQTMRQAATNPQRSHTSHSWRAAFRGIARPPL